MTRDLPDVTLIAIDTVAHDLCRMALGDTLKQINPAEIIVWSDDDRACVPGCQRIEAGPRSLYEVGKLLWYDVPLRVQTSHFVIIQWDGWVLNGDMWTDDFLAFDYIGATWPWHPWKSRVGNGGFSLRSAALMRYVAQHERFAVSYHEDDTLCLKYRPSLERAGFKWAPPIVANKFSFEHQAVDPRASFGFHDCRNWLKILSQEQLRERLSAASVYVHRKPEFQQLKHLASVGCV